MSAAYVTIDLAALKHNAEKVKEYAPDAKIMAVIKANGYGHGVLRVAKALEGVDAFAVARVNEGICLRQAGFGQRILVLEGFVGQVEFDQIIQYDLDVVIYAQEQLAILEGAPAEQEIHVWLKCDTGMNRLGFKPKEFDMAYQRLSRCHNVKQPVSLMTHFSCADDVNDLMTGQQINTFLESIKGCGGECSLANSAGILAWPPSISDWVRPGIMLYGVSPLLNRIGVDEGLKPVMSLVSHLISIKDIEQGESVGYGATWVSPKKSRIGVVSIGYADGYPRYAEEGTPVLLNGKRVPLVGRVSMDMMTIDLTGQSEVKVGDKVILWGKGLAVEEVACCAQTISYVLLCGITARVEIKEI